VEKGLKNKIIKVLSAIKVLDLFWHRLPNGVYVFTYHRIGSSQSTLFDRATYSCTEEAFEKHLLIIKRNFTVITPTELFEITVQTDDLNKRYAIITFDDGYKDNFTHAFPLLQKHNLSAAFYIATEYIDTGKIAWWDEIAFLLRHSCGLEFHLLGTEYSCQLALLTMDKTIQSVMSIIKRLKNVSIEQVLEDTRRQCDQAAILLSATDKNLFMSWSQLRTMAEQGMEIGSHTCSHRVLSRLEDSEQYAELTESKVAIESELNIEVNSVAYPVGRYYCYNQTSLNYSRQLGYKIGFNNEPGYHRSVRNYYDINRFCVAADDFRYVMFDCTFFDNNS